MEVFVGDSTPVGRFILALALIHNDLSDVTLALHLLPVSPLGAQGSIDAGLVHGIALHLTRHKLSIVHELLKLVSEETAALNHDAFRQLLGKLKKEDRAAWEDVVAVAGKHPRESPLGKMLAHCRDNTSNHYGPKVILRGLKQRRETDPSFRPMLTRGNSAHAMRFYFADAAAERALDGHETAGLMKSFLDGSDGLMDAIDRCIYFLVTHFIQLRGFAFRNEIRA